jgi:hypothetical protein
MKRLPLYLLIAITFLQTKPVLSASEDQDTTPRAGKTAQAEKSGSPMTIAVVLDEKPSESVRAVEGVIVDVLSKQNGVTMVDREALGKALAEKQKSAAVFDSLRAAGVLVCIESQPVDPQKPSKGTVLTVQAIAAQTGQLLADARRIIPASGELPKDIDQAAVGLVAAIQRELAYREKASLLEVPPVQLNARNTQLAWMADDLTVSLRSLVDSNTISNLLVPRKPLFTRD